MSFTFATTDTTRSTAKARLIRAAVTGLATAAVGWGLLRLIPQLPIEVFARGTAHLAGLFTGVPVSRVEAGWMLSDASQPVMVTVACSATDFFLIVASLLSWQLVRHGRSSTSASLIGLCAGLPLALAVNALRVVAVAQAHRWLIPAFPDAYRNFLHLLTGVAVFLPALVALNLLLEIYGRPHISRRF